MNLPDENLSGIQLKALLGWKKRKSDKPISTLKKPQLLSLWKEWKIRWVGDDQVAVVVVVNSDATIEAVTEEDNPEGEEEKSSYVDILEEV